MIKAAAPRYYDWLKRLLWAGVMIYTIGEYFYIGLENADDLDDDEDKHNDENE